MAVKIGSNSVSLGVQRQLASTSDRLSSVMNRLSSGMRINTASDDAAGLAIADSLKADSRIFSQGIRNLNDGISYLNIADSALSSLSDITIRLSELSEQAANGTYSRSQRQALHNEAQALTLEFNRVIESTTFNGSRVFSGSTASSLQLQAGYGVDGSIGIDVGKELGRTVGTGTFTTTVTSADSGVGSDIRFADLNGDGFQDMITSAFDRARHYVHLGNGDGTFRASVSYSTGAIPRGTRLGDFNGDGKIDIAAINNNGYADVLYGNGDGTFGASQTTAGLQVEYVLAAGDFNGDGYADLIGGGTWSGTERTLIYYGSASGLQTGQSLGITPRVTNMEVGDFNNDGKKDFVYGTYVGGVFLNVNFAFGNGNGTFSYGVSIAGWGESIKIGDFNGDGNDDVVFGDRYNTKAKVALGNGNGTFKSVTTHETGVDVRQTYVADFNNDGKDDILVQEVVGASMIATILSNGDGTFSGPQSRVVGGGDNGFAFADVNSDGIIDLGTYTSSNLATVFLGNKTTSHYSAWLDLTTQESARGSLGMMRSQLQRISQERGSLGAFQSRLNVASAALQVSSENYRSAESRIRDADVAVEVAELTRLSILQQSASAILSQANQLPALAVTLLNAGRR